MSESTIEIRLMSAMACPEAAGAAGQVIAVPEALGKSLIAANAAELFVRPAPAAKEEERNEVLERVLNEGVTPTPPDFKREKDLVPTGKKGKQ